MRVIDLLSPAGEKAGRIGLPPDIFDAIVSVPLIHQVVVAQLAASHQGTHKTKNRGEARGGGKKPHRQKGTGRARQGSFRAPQFVGGGSVHGPVPRDYSQRTPKKMKVAALRGALTDRAHHNRIHVVTSVVEGSAPSTKAARIALSRISDGKKVLLVAERSEEATWLSARNLPQVHVLESGQLNTYDVILSDDVIFTQAAFENFVQRSELPDIPEYPGWASPESERGFNELVRQAPRRERVAYWSIRVSEEAHRWAEGRAIDPEHERLAVGYLDPKYDEVSSRAFGVILYRHVQDLPPGLSKVVGHLDVDGQIFKIVRRNVIINPALQIDPPPGGMVACWACSTRARGEGWLTARHVVHPLGHIHFSERGVDRGEGAVIQTGAGDIDAALLSTDSPPTPPHTHRITVTPIPLLFDLTFNFTDQNGRIIEGTIEDVETTFPILLDPNYAIRLRLSDAGAHGDSGALIRISESGEAAGLYIEDYTANARWGNPEIIGGVGLAAEQIEAIMGIELRNYE